MSKNNNDLEQDFEQVIKDINIKLELAAQYIKEARIIGANHGIDHLGGNYYMRDDMSDEMINNLEKINFYPVLEQLDGAGWSTSSLHC